MNQPQSKNRLSGSTAWEEYQVDSEKGGYSIAAAGNTAPIISARLIYSIDFGSRYDVKISVSDIDGDNLTFTVNNLPSWLSFDANALRLSGLAGEANIGFYQGISIEVSDGELTTVLGPFSVVVTNTNDTLVISDIPNVSIIENNYFQLSPTVKNTLGKPLFSVINKPAWASFNPDSGKLSGTPDFFSSNTYSNILISVVDGGNYVATPPFQINVINQNRPPTIDGQAMNVLEDEQISFFVSASDLDVEQLNWSLSSGPENGTLEFTNLGDQYFTYRPSPDFFGSDAFMLMVTDSSGAIAQAKFTVNVTPVNDIPFANVDNIYAARGVPQVVYVLSNDVGLGDGGLVADTVKLEVTSSPTQGAATINDNGSISYLANDNATLEDGFIYKITDANNETSLASVSVRINASSDSSVNVNADCTINCSQLVNVSWLPSVSENVAGYYLYYGQVSRQYVNDIWVGQLTSFDHEIISNGQTHYYSLKAMNNAGEYSDFSQEVSLIF